MAAALVLMAAPAQGQFGSQPVGVASTALGVTVTATEAGTVSSVEVLTMGAAGMDFGIAGVGAGDSTCGTASFSAAGQTCKEYVAFTPTAPGVRMGAVELLNTRGLVLGIAYVSGVGTGSLGVLVPGNELTVAGDGSYPGSIGDGNSATSAELDVPMGVVVDGAGNLYIADSGHNRIRMVCAGKTTGTGAACSAAGVIQTIAGNGMPGYSGDQGSGSAATMNDPTGVAVDGAGNLYIADTGNNAIRMIASANGVISTVAGGSSGGDSGGDSLGDGGPAIAAQLKLPQGVTVDAEGNLYIADTGNHRVRMVKVATGIISTVAGSGFGKMNGINEDGGYSGDGGLATGDATGANSTTTSVASNLNPAGFGQGVTFIAVVQTGVATGRLSGTVTFFDGALTLASGVALDAQGATATAIYSTALLGVGKHSISAAYSGDAAHAGSSSTAASGSGLPQPPLIEDVLEGTSTRIVSSANPSTPGESVTFTATAAALPVGGVTPDGSITFMDGTTILANVALNGSATAAYTTATLAAGAHAITASYGGDAARDIIGSTSLTLNQQVMVAVAAPPSFSLSLTQQVTLKTTENATVAVTLASSAGFADTIGLGCVSLPLGVSCHFSPASVALAANGTAADELTIDTENLRTGSAAAMNGRGGNRSSSLAGALATFSLIYGAILWHFRKRHTGVWSVLLVGLLSGMTLMMAGCSGTIVFGAVPGVYVIQVTGTGINTNTIRSQNVMLTITK